MKTGDIKRRQSCMELMVYSYYDAEELILPQVNFSQYVNQCYDNNYIINYTDLH